MQIFSRLKTEGTALMVFPVIGACLALGSCSSNQPSMNQSSGAASPAATAKSETPAATFDLTGAWKPQKVIVKKPRDPLDTSPTFDITLTPKPGQQIIALELTLRPQTRAEPIFSVETILIDSTGERHKSLFAYPSGLTTYKRGGGSIVFLDDWNKANKKVSELGGKVITVFSVPSDRSGFKVEIGGTDPVIVELTAG